MGSGTKEQAPAKSTVATKGAIALLKADHATVSDLFAEYEKAPQVTRDRMYIETMQQVYSNVTKVLVDSRSGSNLLYLPLDKILAGAGTGASASPAEPASNAVSPSLPTTSPSNLSTDSRVRDANRSRERESR